MPQNRFLVDLNAELAKHCVLVHSSEAFWRMEGDFDVVHLHFPEYLTYEIEKAYQVGLSDELMAETVRRLDYWARCARVLVTRHVLLPHDALRNARWEKMYAAFYRYAHGVVHFARASIDEFRQRYAGVDWFAGREPAHAIVPHHNYASLPNQIGRAEARARLRISPRARVMLAFGAIRHDAERRLILESFRALKMAHKVLLVSRWPEQLPRIRWIRLKYWIRDLIRWYHRHHPSYRFNYGFVEEAETQVYLNAADVLFIPRLWVLNSGNVTLGMTFGRVVVGPDAWDVGELLRQTGNPTFDPDAPATASSALMEGFRLAAAGSLGRMNREKALTEWGVDRCAGSYLQFYGQLLA